MGGRIARRGTSAAAPAEDFYGEAQPLQAKYAADLAKLAAWCDEQGLAAEAKQTRQALGPHDPYKLYLPILPSDVGPPQPPEGAGPETLQWHKRFCTSARSRRPPSTTWPSGPSASIRPRWPTSSSWT